MENSEKSTASEQKQPEFSLISLVIALLLGIVLIVFLEFAVNDITRTLYGEKPVQPTFSQVGREGSQYKNTYYQNYEEAQTAYEKAELIPYETKALLINTIISTPLFLLAIGLFLSIGKLKPSFKLITGTFFLAMVIKMFRLLGNLGIYVYRINERLAIYGISLFLIIIFAASVILVQEKIRSKAAT